MRSDKLRDDIFTPELRRRLDEVAEVETGGVLTEFDSPEAKAVLARIDVLVSGWGSARIDRRVLDAAPSLALVAHSAGTVKGHVDPVVWERGVAVTTAAQANGLPVADFTVAMIVLAGKKAFTASSALRAAQGSFDKSTLPADVGNHRSTVGIIGASRIGRLVLERLRSFEVDVLLATPDLDAAAAERLGARLVSLDDLMAASDVVSLHAPVLPQTIGMIGAAQLAAMRDGATFINTARGVLVDHDALRRHTESGRIAAVLDVTDPEPLPTGDILYTLPNVFLTPHIAGAMGNELELMGESVVDEIERYATGRPYVFPVTLHDLDRMA